MAILDCEIDNRRAHLRVAGFWEIHDFLWSCRLQMLQAEIVETYLSLWSLPQFFSSFYFSDAQKWMVHDTFSSLVYACLSFTIYVNILMYLLKTPPSPKMLNSSPSPKTRSCPYFASTYAPFLREGNGTLLQYSCLENPMDGGAW